MLSRSPGGAAEGGRVLGVPLGRHRAEPAGGVRDDGLSREEAAGAAHSRGGEGRGSLAAIERAGGPGAEGKQGQDSGSFFVPIFVPTGQPGPARDGMTVGQEDAEMCYLSTFLQCDMPGQDGALRTCYKAAHITVQDTRL
jgi:hypothetical protein